MENLGTLEVPRDPAAERALAERAELQRRLAVSAIERAEAGEPIAPLFLARCRALVASTQPLAGPLGDGVPAAAALAARDAQRERLAGDARFGVVAAGVAA